MKLLSIFHIELVKKTASGFNSVEMMLIEIYVNIYKRVLIMCCQVLPRIHLFLCVLFVVKTLYASKKISVTSCMQTRRSRWCRLRLMSNCQITCSFKWHQDNDWKKKRWKLKTEPMGPWHLINNSSQHLSFFYGQARNEKNSYHTSHFYGIT